MPGVPGREPEISNDADASSLAVLTDSLPVFDAGHGSGASLVRAA
jgi:hypothetical protein